MPKSKPKPQAVPPSAPTDEGARNAFLARMRGSFDDGVVAALTSVRYHVSQEGPLHDAIARVLASNGIEAEHEVKLGPRERIDFLVGDVGIEIKMRGTVSKIAAQLWRYAKSPRVRVLLLATTRASYVELDGVEWYGKRVRVVRLPGGLI